MLIPLNEILISPCETYHLHKGVAIYSARFHKVLKFREPGLAAVNDSSGAYHINMRGNPAYKERHHQTFSFYEMRAAVEGKNEGWHHINPDGSPLYEEHYAWCGNFQEEICSVRDKQGNYFHINLNGKRLYHQTYAYVGDFKDGIAAVLHNNGKSFHIDRQGQYIHTHGYLQADIFHKGFARARDDQGWFHITKEGIPAYSERFADLEPFYNGQAYVRTHEGDIVIINEKGQIIKNIYIAPKSKVHELSSHFVSFWESETLKLAIEIKVLDRLPGSLEKIAKKISLPQENLERLLRALWEIGIVKLQKDKEWVLTEKGQLLFPTGNSFMAAASLMWSKVQMEWRTLNEKIKLYPIKHHPTFKEVTNEPEALDIYHQALTGYTLEDFADVITWQIWSTHTSLLTVGQTGFVLLKEILKRTPFLKGSCLNEDIPFYHIKNKENLGERLKQVFLRLNSSWDIQADAIIMPRFLHYFPDLEAQNILSRAHQSLFQKGKLYLFEMVIDHAFPAGSLLDLNMLAESGGKLRTLSQWDDLFKKTNFIIEEHRTLKPHLHLITGIKK